MWFAVTKKKARALLAGLAVLLLGALVVAWTAFDVADKANGRSVYEILNDDYTQVVAIPQGAWLEQTVELPAGRTLYGMRFDFCTYEYAFQSGAVTAELWDAGGALLASGTLDCIGLKDNTFAEVIFGQPYAGQPAPAVQSQAELGAEVPTEQLVVRLYYDAPADEGRPLGIWASTGQVGGLALCTGGGTPQALDATAAMQFVVEHSGSWSWGFSALMGGLVLAAVAAAFLLLFVAKAGLGAVFLAAGLLLGGAFSVLTPPLVAPDEYTHLAYSYQVATGLLGLPNESADGKLMIRACDAPYFVNHTGAYSVFAYKQMAEHLGDRGQATDLTVESRFPVAEIPDKVLYLPQILGVALGLKLGLGFHGLLLLARWMNLLCYLLLVRLALHWMPHRWRGLLACVALLPMPLQLAASICRDAALVGLVFAYTALCLGLRERPASRGQAAALVVLAACIGPSKAVYLPVVLLCLLIPGGNLAPALPARRHAGAWIRAACLGVASALWAWANLAAALYSARDMNPAALAGVLVAAATAVAFFAVVYWRIHRDPALRRIFWRVAAVAAVVAVAVAAFAASRMGGGLTPEQLLAELPNGDAAFNFTAGYILHNLPATVKLLLRSVTAQGALWLQSLIGTTLGEPIVYRVDVSWLLGVALVVVLLAAALPCAAQQGLKPLGRRGRWGCAAVAACVVALTFFVALSWTPINYTTIFGVQGRYWLPLLPLALLLAGECAPVAAAKPLARRAVLATVCLTSLVILEGYGLYATAPYVI